MWNKLEQILILKKGGIHIKKKNRGKFTEYCGGKVTEECIKKGKNSSNPTIRKRATFAANARKWKRNGGVLFAQGGTGNLRNPFIEAEYERLSKLPNSHSFSTPQSVKDYKQKTFIEPRLQDVAYLNDLYGPNWSTLVSTGQRTLTRDLATGKPKLTINDKPLESEDLAIASAFLPGADYISNAIDFVNAGSNLLEGNVQPMASFIADNKVSEGVDELKDWGLKKITKHL